MLGRVLSWIKAHPKTSVAIGLALAAILYFALRPTPKTYEYISATVDRGEVVRRVTASGKLRALNTIKVGAEVSGQITRVFVDFNTPVTAGQVLAEIDPTRVICPETSAPTLIVFSARSLPEAVTRRTTSPRSTVALIYS